MKFYISGGGDMYWRATKAKTLRGAKMIASKMYEVSISGKIEIGAEEYRDDEGNIGYMRVAVKYGHGEWINSAGWRRS